MLHYWSCESLYRSWGNPDCDQLLLLILAVGNFKGQVRIMAFSTSFHQQCLSLSLSPSTSTFIKWEWEYHLPPFKETRVIRALFPCLKSYSPPCEKIPTGVTIA